MSPVLTRDSLGGAMDYHPCTIDLARSKLEEDLIPIQPVTNVPQCAPYRETRYDAGRERAGPGEERVCEGREYLVDDRGGSNTHEQVDENRVHPHNNKEPGAARELLLDVNQPV